MCKFGLCFMTAGREPAAADRRRVAGLLALAGRRRGALVSLPLLLFLPLQLPMDGESPGQ